MSISTNAEHSPPPSSSPSAAPLYCEWLWHSVTVLCDGTVTCGCADPFKTRNHGSLKSSSLREIFAGEFPHAEIVTASPRTRSGLDDWFARIATAEQQPRTAMKVDYETYAEGEALLAGLRDAAREAAAGVTGARIDVEGGITRAPLERTDASVPITSRSGRSVPR